MDTNSGNADKNVGNAAGAGKTERRVKARDEDQILECPFCGGKAFLTEDYVSEYTADGKIWHVTCADSCSVAPGVYAQQTKGGAIQKWNTRAGKSQHELLCDEHRKAFRVFHVGGCLKCWQENECGPNTHARPADEIVLQFIQDHTKLPVDGLVHQELVRIIEAERNTGRDRAALKATE